MMTWTTANNFGFLCSVLFGVIAVINRLDGIGCIWDVTEAFMDRYGVLPGTNLRVHRAISAVSGLITICESRTFRRPANPQDAQAAILCSRCDSRKDNYYGECEQHPPDPTPCPENSDSMFCSIVREIDFEGIQLLFARDCATTYSDERCIVRNITIGNTVRQKNVCFRTCATSGCNSESLSPRGSSIRLSAPSFLISMTFLFVLLSSYINNCYQW